MNATKLTSLMLGVASLAVLGACKQSGSEVAQVTATPAKTAHEVCEDQSVTHEKPVKDKDRVLGTVAGALVGGVVGHKVGGHGTGQDIATVGGAAAGGYAGNRVQKSVQDNATETSTERVCHTEYN